MAESFVYYQIDPADPLQGLLKIVSHRRITPEEATGLEVLVVSPEMARKFTDEGENASLWYVQIHRDGASLAKRKINTAIHPNLDTFREISQTEENPIILVRVSPETVEVRFAEGAPRTSDMRLSFFVTEYKEPNILLDWFVCATGQLIESSYIHRLGCKLPARFSVFTNEVVRGYRLEIRDAHLTGTPDGSTEEPAG